MLGSLRKYVTIASRVLSEVNDVSVIVTYLLVQSDRGDPEITL